MGQYTNDFLLAAKGLGLRDCSEKQTQNVDVDPNMSNDQNLDSLNLDSVIKEMTINPTTTPKKLDKPRQISVG